MYSVSQFEAGNDFVSRNFDIKNFMMIISQEIAVNGEVGVRHYGWELRTGS